jgi:hypothetical protein
MPCENPRRVRNPRYKFNDENLIRPEVAQAMDFYSSVGYREPPDKYLSVPCGKCSSCVRTRMLGYKIRLLSELEHTTGKSTFITLTFDDYNLHRFKDNPNKSVRLFLDRMRKRLGRSIRHWICAEYGERNTKRLHYHGILFDIPDSLDEDMLTSLWTYGISHFGYICDETVPYLTKYVTKTEQKEGQKLPRIISSFGIGKDFINDYSYLKPLLQSSIPGKQGVIPLPRYLKTKLFDDYELLLIQEMARKDDFVRYVDGRRITNELDYVIALKRFSAKQRSLKLSPSPNKKPRSAMHSLVSYGVDDETLFVNVDKNLI